MNSDFTTIAAATGPVSFDWSFFSHRVHSPDGFGYLLNGSFTQLADQSSLGSGSSQFNVLAGDGFGFRAYTLDNEVGAGTATISNFSAPFSDPTPVPGPLPLLGAGAAFSCSRRLRRRTSLAHGQGFFVFTFPRASSSTPATISTVIRAMHRCRPAVDPHAGAGPAGRHRLPGGAPGVASGSGRDLYLGRQGGLRPPCLVAE